MLSFQKRSKGNVGGQEGAGKLAASLENFHTSVSQRTTKPKQAGVLLFFIAVISYCSLS